MAGITLMVGGVGASSSSSSSAPKGEIGLSVDGTNCRWMAALLNQAAVMDLRQLVVVPPRTAWRVQVACQVLHNDGNTDDACLLAAVAALRDCRLPSVQLTPDGTVEIAPKDDNDDNGDDNDKEMKDGNDNSWKPIVFRNVPVPLTMGVYIQQDGTRALLADPTAQEQPALEGTIRVVVSEHERLLHVSQSALSAVSRSDLALASQMAFQRAKDMLSTVLDA